MKVKSFFSQNQFAVIAIILVVVGLVVYANTFPNKMFWDDDDFILNNAYVKNFNVGKFFSENVIAGAGLVSDYWRPVLLTVFGIEWQLWGDAPPGYHLVNTLFHIADGLLLFYLLNLLFRKRLLAFVISLIFLVHPLQTEAVSYVNSLGDSLSVFFIFSGLIFYLHARMPGISQMKFGTFYFLGIASYILSLFSKETAIIFPALLLLVELFLCLQNSKRTPVKQFLAEAILRIIPFFLIAGIYLFLRNTTLNFKNTFNLYNEPNYYTEHLSARIFTFLKVFPTYVGLLFAPIHLHVERSVDVATSFFNSRVVLGSLLMVSMILPAFSLIRRKPEYAFATGWFLIGFLPTSGIIVPANALLYEHWLYLPLIGFFLFLGFLIRDLLKKIPSLTKPISIIIVLALLFFSVRTIMRNTDWKDPITFYGKTLRYAPESVRVWNNLGMAYIDSGNYEKGKSAYIKAIELDPTNAVPHYNLGNSYRDEGRLDRAITEWEKALTLDPNFIFAYRALQKYYPDPTATTKE